MNTIFIIGCLFAAIQCAGAANVCITTASKANNTSNKAKNVIKKLSCISDSQASTTGVYSRQYNSYKVTLSKNKCKQRIVSFPTIPVSCCVSATSGASSAANNAKALIEGSACLTDSQIRSVNALTQQYNAYKSVINKNKCGQTIVLLPEAPASCCFVALSGMNAEISNIRVVTKGRHCIISSDATKVSSYVSSYNKFKKDFAARKCTQVVPILPVIPRMCLPPPPARRPSPPLFDQRMPPPVVTTLPPQAVIGFSIPPPLGLIPKGASCYDDVQNGDEEGIDCGGSCPFLCQDLIPCVFASDTPVMTYYAVNANTDLPFVHIVFSNMCSLFTSVPKNIPEDYLRLPVDVYLFGSFDNLTVMQYENPEPGHSYTTWDLTVSPPRVTINTNDTVVYPVGPFVPQSRSLLQSSEPDCLVQKKKCELICSVVTAVFFVAPCTAMGTASVPIPNLALGIAVGCYVLIEQRDCKQLCSYINCEQNICTPEGVLCGRALPCCNSPPVTCYHQDRYTPKRCRA